MIIFALFLVLLFSAGIGALVTTDLLVRLEYNFHRDEWEADGQPYGLVWTPPGRKRGLSYAFGNFGLQAMAFQWLVSTPDWMEEDERARRLIFWMRLCTAVWIGGMVLFALIMIPKSNQS